MTERGFVYSSVDATPTEAESSGSDVTKVVVDGTATGAFEKVVPMDILPMYLFKAIIANDYDEMEALGIYELIEEDVALCEFIDVSKNDLQALLRDGIELIRNS